jgi:hypothetical protein
VYRGFDDDESCDEEEERPIQRFYEVEEENDDGEMETRYHRIAPVNGEAEDEEDSNRRLNPPKATNRPRMNIHTNDEIKLLWRMGDVVLGEQFGSGVLECQVERLDNDELWKENHMKMCEFVISNKKSPLSTSKKPEEKRLGSWVSNQKRKYDPQGSEFSEHIMKNQEIWKLWFETLADSRFSEALADPAQRWKNKHYQMCKFIETNCRSPSPHSKLHYEKILGCWISTQKTNYDENGSEHSRCIMKTTPETWQLWTDTLASPKYNKHLVFDLVENWKNNHKNVCEYIEKNGRAPSTIAKNSDDKKMGVWVSTQKDKYDANGSKMSKGIMKNDELWQLWVETLANPKYSEALSDPVQIWKNSHKKILKSHKSLFNLIFHGLSFDYTMMLLYLIAE